MGCGENELNKFTTQDLFAEWVVENKDLFVSEKVVDKLATFSEVGGRPRIYL